MWAWLWLFLLKRWRKWSKTIYDPWYKTLSQSFPPHPGTVGTWRYNQNVFLSFSQHERIHEDHCSPWSGENSWKASVSSEVHVGDRWKLKTRWKSFIHLVVVGGLLFCKFFIWPHVGLLKQILSAVQVPTSGISPSVGTPCSNSCQHPSSHCQLRGSGSSWGWGGATPVFLVSGWNEAEGRERVRTGRLAGVWGVGWSSTWRFQTRRVNVAFTD